MQYWVVLYSLGRNKENMDDELKDTNKIYISVNPETGSTFAKINIKDKIAKELLRMGWKSQADVITKITEREGKRGIWIELF